MRTKQREPVMAWIEHKSVGVKPRPKGSQFQVHPDGNRKTRRSNVTR